MASKKDKRAVIGSEEQDIITKIKHSINPNNNQTYSKEYFRLLKERKKLPAYDAKGELQALIKKY